MKYGGQSIISFRNRHNNQIASIIQLSGVAIVPWHHCAIVSTFGRGLNNLMCASLATNIAQQRTNQLNYFYEKKLECLVCKMGSKKYHGSPRGSCSHWRVFFGIAPPMLDSKRKKCGILLEIYPYPYHYPGHFFGRQNDALF